VSAKIEDQEGCGDGSDLAPSRQGAKIAWRLGVFARDLALSNLQSSIIYPRFAAANLFIPFPSTFWKR